MNSSQTDVDPVALFFSNWAIYRSVIDNDCMEHHEIYTAVGDVLAERDAPFTVLDLGCGDAAGSARALSGTRVVRYTGVDNASPALEFATAMLAGADFEVELLEGDLAASVRNGRTYDVVIMAFALHHFDATEKRRILSDIRACLNPGGELLLIDLVRRQGQSRDEYVAAYSDYVRGWPLPGERIDAIIAHVQDYDFPEEQDTQPDWARELGYRDVKAFYSGGNGTQRAWRFRR